VFGFLVILRILNEVKGALIISIHLERAQIRAGIALISILLPGERHFHSFQLRWPLSPSTAHNPTGLHTFSYVIYALL
jgi:hypothetical protein